MKYKILGSLLKDARKNSKLTQKDVADKLGVTFQNISSWELGKSKIDIDNLLKLCDLYGISFIDLVNKANHKEIQSSLDEHIIDTLANNITMRQFINILSTLSDDKQTELLETAIFLAEKKLQQQQK